MEINPNYIHEAEIMLLKGKTFDDNRKTFICNLTTCDLLAVPGSGKTTALMAKLYALSKLLPFEDGSGILVLAHTNASVDEIEHKLKKLCPNLFEYPNFVGTIQGFVNKFLASPANAIKYGSYISKNDDEIANKRIVKCISKLPYNNPLKKYFFFQIYGQNTIVSQKELIEDFSLSKEKSKEFIVKMKAERILTKNGFDYIKVKNDQAISILNIDDEFKNIIKLINKRAKDIVDVAKNDRATLYRIDFIKRNFLYGNTQFGFDSDSGKELLNIFETQFHEGIARYKDCYSLGTWYLENYSQVKEQLKYRFKYVFIDEMQDLEDFQIKLIDNVFNEGRLATVLQRIGDINQSIYNSSKKVKIECDWKTRNELYLIGSNRLTKANAEIVNCFTLDNKVGKFIVEGKRELPNGDIPPHLLLFTNDTKGKLKSRFEQLIQEYNLTEIEEAKNGFKIIGWTGERENEGDGKLCLHTIFGFTKQSKSKKEDFDTLGKHLQLFSQERKTLEAVRKSILNAFITILRLENKKLEKNIRGNKVERYYTKSDLIEFIKNHKNEEIEPESHEVFKGKLFNWCFNLVTKQEYKEIYCEVADFINNDLKKWFDLTLTGKEVADFIGTEFKLVENNLAASTSSEDVSSDLNIEIATVHSVKGQTHCATMYVETAYNTPTYETQKLKEESKTKTRQKKESKTNPLFKQSHTCEGTYAKQALKMMYVGFSRPTHLLCFAILKDNIGDNLEEYKNAGWEVVDITN